MKIYINNRSYSMFEIGFVLLANKSNRPRKPNDNWHRDNS